MTDIAALPRGIDPMSGDGIVRDADGVAHYEGLPASLIAMFERFVQDRPDQEAVVEVGGERLTFRQLWDRAAEVAGGLRAQGVQDGDRVAILSPAGMSWVLAFWGSLFAGAIAVPVNTRFAQPEIDYVVNDSGAVFTFPPDGSLPSGEPYVVSGRGLTDPAAIFYTSGTTGFPKGALTSHEAFLTNCENMRRGMGLTGDQLGALRTLISVPLFHVTGCNSQLLVTMYGGGTSVILPALDLNVLLQLLVDERINWIVTVPAVYNLMIRHPQFDSFDVSGIELIGYGGAPIAPELVARLKSAFPNAKLFNGFGMTETASLLTVLPHDFAEDHADSVGFAVPVADLSVADPDPETGVGELLARAPNVTTGYWNKPDATRDSFTGRWLHTGDLARVSEDGLVYLVDRAKDMINRGGENVYSVEVENALAGAPGVGESAVIGVPDDVMGEKVGAVIVPAAGATVDPAEIVAYLKDVLADFKIPQFIAVSDEPLPRNPGGKILKPSLRKDTEWGKPLR